MKQIRKNKKIAYIYISIALCFFILSAYFYIQKKSVPIQNSTQNIEVNNSSTQIQKDISSEEKITIYKKAEIKIGDQVFLISFSENQTLYDVMKVLESEQKISFEGKEYPALGFFVTSIGGLENGDGKYLFYYINGVEASTGVSSYRLKEGDSIEWKLK